MKTLAQLVDYINFRPDHMPENKTKNKMKRRKYYYIVRCQNGINCTETVEYAENHYVAEGHGMKAYYVYYQAYPLDVSSRKITRRAADNIRTI